MPDTRKAEMGRLRRMRRRCHRRGVGSEIVTVFRESVGKNDEHTYRNRINSSGGVARVRSCDSACDDHYHPGQPSPATTTLASDRKAGHQDRSNCAVQRMIKSRRTALSGMQRRAMHAAQTVTTDHVDVVLNARRKVTQDFLNKLLEVKRRHPPG